EESLKSSILAGIDPAGNQLNTMMPRWQMSAEDLDSLIEYLKIK
ncbi:MAG: cytochrome c, partial [Nitrospirae bacterium]|nr:cytochrome c [Nitrospirota bacterium]